jgi:hypothetical protein
MKTDRFYDFVGLLKKSLVPRKKNNSSGTVYNGLIAVSPLNCLPFYVIQILIVKNYPRKTEENVANLVIILFKIKSFSIKNVKVKLHDTTFFILFVLSSNRKLKKLCTYFFIRSRGISPYVNIGNLEAFGHMV